MKRVSVFVLLFAIVMASIGVFATESQARLSNNNRRAVVLECFYALRSSADGSCDKTINGNCVSNWDYLNRDTYAYGVVKGWYSCYSSDWTSTGDGSGCYNNYYPVSFFSNVSSYSYGTHGGSYGNVGRGGQCKYFANLILYRSESDQRAFPTYSTMSGNAESNLSKAVQGDVLFSTTVPHTAIIVELKTDGLDVIDANYVTDISGTPSREVIGRHLIPWSTLSANGYKIYKGVSYYNEPYIP